MVATVAHPGAAVSQLFQVAAGAGFMPGWQLGERLGVAQSCADGSTPLLLAATGTDVVGGEYFGPANGIMGAPRRDAACFTNVPGFTNLKPSRSARAPVAAARLPLSRGSLTLALSAASTVLCVRYGFGRAARCAS